MPVPDRLSGFFAFALPTLLFSAILTHPLPARAEDPVKVALSFSSQAMEKLRAGREGVVISLSYYGEPKPEADSEADEFGMIDLGRDEVVVEPADGPQAVPTNGLQADRLGLVRTGEAEVNINVYSARRSGPDNILDCDIYEGALSAIRQAPAPIACRLIGE